MAVSDLQTIAFPTLDEAQIAVIGRFADAPPRLFRDGETLIALGQRDFGLFLVKSGAVEIIDDSGDEPRIDVVFHAGQFTGEVSLLLGTAVASAVARGDTEVYELSRDALRRLLN